MYPLRSFFLATILLCAAGRAFSQPAELQWLKKNGSEKSQQTLAILGADPNGYYLLRAQIDHSNLTVVRLDAEGVETAQQPIRGFRGTMQAFTANDSLLLLLTVNEQDAWRVIRYRFKEQQWIDPGIELGFAKLAANNGIEGARYGIRTSSDGRRICAYLIEAQPGGWRVQLAVFNERLELLWRRRAELPQQEGAVIPRQVFCSAKGEVFLHAHVFSAGAKVAFAEFNHVRALCRRDGRPIYQNDYVTADGGPKVSNAIFSIQEGNAAIDAYFVKATTKHTRSLEIAEAPDGSIICAGLGGEKTQEEVDEYFFYRIDPTLKKAEMVKSAAIPMSFRKAFLNENDAEKKEPVSDVFIRHLLWDKDGKAWLLVEKERFSAQNGAIETAAMCRIDSTWRISGVTPIEKYHRVKAADPGSTGTVGICPADKGTWWMLWNKGALPYTDVMLTPGKGKESFALSNASQSGVVFQPHTLYPYQDQWYFVGESDDHRFYRLGSVKKKRHKG